MVTNKAFLIPLFLYSFIPLFHYSFIPLFLYSFIPLFLYTFIPLVLYSFIPLFLYSFIPSFLHSFIPSFLHSFIPLFLYSFIPLFLYSFIPLFLYLDVMAPDSRCISRRLYIFGGYGPPIAGHLTDNGQYLADESTAQWVRHNAVFYSPRRHSVKSDRTLEPDHPLFDWLINCVILNHV